MNANLQSALISILADVDALWLPMRWGHGPQPAFAAVAERRGWFSNRGIDLTIGGGAAERKAGERELAELRRLGMVRIHRGRGRRCGVALTVAGDDYARSITPNKRVDESWGILGHVAAVNAEFDGETNAGFVLEFDLTDDLPKLEDEALPLLARGLLESWSDTEGRIGYRTTDNGKALLEAGQPAPPSDLPDYHGDVGQEFEDLYLAALAERDSWKPTTPNQVAIPLGAGSWPERPVSGLAHVGDNGHA